MLVEPPSTSQRPTVAGSTPGPGLTSMVRWTCGLIHLNSVDHALVGHVLVHLEHGERVVRQGVTGIGAPEYQQRDDDYERIGHSRYLPAAGGAGRPDRKAARSSSNGSQASGGSGS